MKNNNRSLSIVHINTHDIAGGAAKVARRLAEVQRINGHNSRMVVGTKSSQTEHSSAFPIECDPALQSYCQENGQLFYEYQGSHKLIAHPIVKSADILHLHNLHGGYFNPFSLSSLSHLKPIVWTLHDMQAITGHCAHSFDCQRWQTVCGLCPYLNIEPAITIDTSAQLLRDKKLIYEHSRLWLVTPSQWLKSKIEKSILKNHAVQLIYNCVDTTVFRPYDKTEARRKFGIPAKAIVIGAVAHGGVLTNQWKGGKYTQEALDALKNKLPDYVFVNIGGNYETYRSRVINIPHVDNEHELAQAYSTLDVFLNTSIADNCPLVILEALSCGIPIISFTTGGIPELVRNGKDGYVTEYKNIRQIVEAVESLATNHRLLSEFSLNARERAASKFDTQIIANQYENLYQQVLKASKTTKKDIKLFPMSNMPQIIKTKSFIEAENSKEIIIKTNNPYLKTNYISDLSNQSEAVQLDYSGLFKKGVAFLNRRNPLEALNCFDKILERTNFDLPNIHYARAVAYIQTGKIQEAKSACETELSIDPKNTSAELLLSNLRRYESCTQSPRTKFILLFNGRSAGTLLQRSLNKHPNIICEGEVLAYLPLDKQMEKLREIHNTKADGILASGLKTKLVAIKQSDYKTLKDYIHNNSVKIIHLYRENPIKQAISKCVAMELFERRKKFEIYDLKERVTPLPIDFQVFKEELLYVLEYERRLFCFVQNFDDRKQISFEHFTKNKDETLRDIQQWLGVPVYDNIIEPMKKVVPEDLSKAVLNYEEFSRKIANLLANYRICTINKELPFSRYLSHQE
jgi:glycosyltransferase involved in cell wall biosynthesis/uncharacterized short protein YbdD (DUF466 family)